MRDGRMPSEIASVDKAHLKREFEFFNIPYPSQCKSSETPFKNPKDAIPAYNTPNEALAAVKAWLPQVHHFSLIYKASRDGFSSQAFHQKCDDIGPTLTIIQSKEGYIFGGYSPRNWNTSKSYFSHPHTFLFTLTNPHSIPPTKFHLRRHDPLAVCCRPDRCSVFGGGYDICVGSNSDKISRDSYSRFPCSFVDTVGLGNLTFTGRRNFLTKEVEVYACI